MKLAERLGGPHEWGYRDIIDGKFIADNAPFEAATEIEQLRSALKEADEMLSQVRGIPTECIERDASRKAAPCNAVWCAEYDDCMVARTERRAAALTGKPTP